MNYVINVDYSTYNNALSNFEYVSTTRHELSDSLTLKKHNFNDPTGWLFTFNIVSVEKIDNIHYLYKLD